MAVTTPNGFDYTTTPITSTTPGEVIQNLVIDVTGDQPAISVTSDNVTIKNVLIHTTTGDGIDVWGNQASISNVEVDGPTPTDNGGMDGGGSSGIYSDGVSGLKVDHATFRNVGTGVAAINSPGTVLTNIEGHNMQGPFPGGQLVQFGSSDGSSLTNFSVENDAALSHPEDDISVYASRNTTISQGVVDGDNSPSGVGVMVEGDSGGTRVSNVDAIHMGDGAFSAYSNNVDFTNVRSFDNIAGDQGRGTPLSNGLIFYAQGDNVSFDNASYSDPGDPNNVYGGNSSTQADISENDNAVPMAPLNNSFLWDASGSDDQGPNTGSGQTSAASSDGGQASKAPSQSGSTATAPNQTFTSTSHDKFDANGQAHTTFVFEPGYAHDVVKSFVAAGGNSDTVDLPSSDFSSVAAVLHHTHNIGAGAVIFDPISHDTVRLVGVGKAELRENRGDFTFHG